MLTLEMGITLVILVVAVVLFVTEWLRVDVVALCVVIVLMATGLLTTEEALAGFSSTTVLTIAALFVVGGAAFQTGVAAKIGDWILGIAGTSETRLLVVLMTAVAIMSAFISSTGVVALMLPAVMRIAHRSNIPPSKLLMPLAFSSLIGGSLTLIGTPPNIVASNTLMNAGYEPFQFFSFTPIGGLLLVIGVGFIYLFGRRLLPDRRPKQMTQQMETPAELFELYRLPEDLFRLRVHRESKLIGSTMESLQLRETFHINIINITNNGRTIHCPPSDTVLQENDVIVVQGKGNDVGKAAAFWNLGMVANQPIREQDVITNEVGIAEVLLRPRSSLIGKTIAGFRFGSAYKLTVLNLYRPGAAEPLDVKETHLKFGDVLLVQGEWKNIFALKQLRHDFIVMGEPEALKMGAFARLSHAPVTLIILALMVLAIMFNLVPLTLASLIAAVALVLTGCVTMNEAYESIDPKSLLLIAGLLPMSTALVNVGLVDLFSSALTSTLGEMGTWATLAGLFLLTGFFTQILSNTVTAVLIAPIALTTAQSLNAEPQAFLMAVAIAASMAFISPIGSPVNTLVMTSGNYRFSDYARVGVPLFIVTFVASMLLLPVLFPF
ncbi:MAG: SLC13 family permease [Anaerolineae bacterium]|nr:SLC13 family permease [Anaerolineae bacterium]